MLTATTAIPFHNGYIKPRRPRSLLSEDVLQPANEGTSTEAPVYVRVHGHPPKWLTRVVERLNELLSLPAGWNSYGAKPVKLTSALSSLNFLLNYMDDSMPLPAVVPTSSGDVQVEWHTESLDIEVRFIGRRRVTVFYENTELDEVQEFVLNAELEDKLQQLLGQLS